MSPNVDEAGRLEKKEKRRDVFRLTTKGSKVNKTIGKPLQS